MSAYRFLLGPIPFLGVEVYEAHEISETGEARSGAGADPVAAVAELEAELARRGDPTADWRAAPSLRAALGLGEARAGWPGPAQREAMLIASLQRAPAGALWPVEDPRVAEGSLAGLSLFARHAAALPARQPFAFRAEVTGTLEGGSYVVFSRRGSRAQVAAVRAPVELDALIDAATREEERDPDVNLTVACVDLTPGWLAAVMQEAFGVAFSPLLFERRRGGARAPVDDTVAILLGAFAAAFPGPPARPGEALPASEGTLAAGPEDLTCRLTPLS